MKEVTKEEYNQFFNINKDKLKLIVCFSDLKYEYPYMDTYWGIEDDKLARCIMTKKSDKDMDVDYVCQYFLK